MTNFSETMTEAIEKYFDRLWPINRSIMGPGFRSSLEILSEVMPMKYHSFATGTQVLDWEVPREWDVREAYIIDPTGKKIANFSENNLHLVGYSIPYKGRLTLDELKPHLHTIQHLPHAIPYVTSYYREYWGFCITQDEYNNLTDGEYQVVVDTLLYPGELITGEAVIEGSSSEEILFSTYLCHPSLANNELSGPLGMVFLYDRIKSIPNPRFTYRFLISSETIGTIAYLSKMGAHLKENVIAGYQMTCIAENSAFTYKKSRQENSLADRAARMSLRDCGEQFEVVQFDPGDGSDERQYCSPGFNLPLGSLMRTQYGKYIEYHTSLDNKDFIDFEKLKGSVYQYFDIVKTLEANICWVSSMQHGEPQLGKRGLYPSLADKTSLAEQVKATLWILNYADGKHDLIDVANLSGFSIKILSGVAESLFSKGILKKQEQYSANFNRKPNL